MSNKGGIGGLPEVGDIPVIGPWAGKISLIQDMWAEPCQPTPMVWALATVASIPLLAITLIKPDTIDEYYERNGRPHKRKRKKKVTLGELLEIVRGGKGPGIPAGFALAGDLAQKLGFWMILIDGTLDLAINSTSLAYEWQGCKGWAPSIGYLSDEFLYGSGSTQLLFIDFQNPNPVWTALSWTVPNTEGRQFSASVSWYPDDRFDNPATQVTIEIVDITHGIVKTMPHPELNGLQGWYGTATLNKNYQAANGQTTYQLHATGNGNFTVAGQVYVYANGQDPRDAIGFDP